MGDVSGPDRATIVPLHLVVDMFVDVWPALPHSSSAFLSNTDHVLENPEATEDQDIER
jgi:hypothetical protein